ESIVIAVSRIREIVVAGRLIVVCEASYGAKVFTLIHCLTVILLCYLVGVLSFQLLSSLSSHSSLSANAGATCDIPVPVSAVKLIQFLYQKTICPVPSGWDGSIRAYIITNLNP